MKAIASKTIIRAAAGLVLALLVAGSIPLASAPAAAQGVPSVCQAREGLLTQLEQKYGEVPVAIGVSEGALIELLTAKDGVTWTIIVTSPKGISCLIAAGEGWRPLTPAATGPSV